MNDDLDDLKAAIRVATPTSHAEVKADHLALAQENFQRLQETRARTRPISDRPLSGFWTGARKMLTTLTSRAGLTATTAIVAVALVALTPMRNMMLPPDGMILPPLPEPVELREEAEMADAMTEMPPQEEEVPQYRSRLTKTAPQASSVGAAISGRIADSDIVRAAPLPADRQIKSPENDTETFANAESNSLHVTAESPVSTFSIDVDTASYAVIRNSLLNGYLPDPTAVRVEEMVNYFTYDYPAPEHDAAFRSTISVAPSPWNAGAKLVQIGIQGNLPAIADRPPLNLVFLIDTSGSMDQPNKLPLLKQSFALLLGQLRPEDQVAIVTYAGSAGQVLDPTAASERAKILAALNRLDAGGSTAGQAGLQQAYATAAAMAEDGEINRVILATDGDFNVGLSDPDALQDFISAQRDSGTYLSVLGFGRGNLDDAAMQALAQNGNGQAAYIDTLAEAQKVLVDQLTGALFPIANDVKIQVEFNPATVAEYRLIGYETRALRREDFNNDKVDAGDIGAGHTVTALYEITPVGSPSRLTEPLRYQAAGSTDGSANELGFLRLRYKAPGSDESQLIEQPITADMPPATDSGFAAAIAGFGQLLRQSDYLGDWGYDDAIALANDNKGDDPFGYRTEAVQLMRLAQSLAIR